MIARARLWPEAREDINALPNRPLRLAATRAVMSLQENPWSGEEVRARSRVGDLRGLRRIALDEPDWGDKPRYRVVYRNEPDDGVVEIVAVIAVGLRESLAIYKEAAARLRKEMRRRLTE
ncbi:MAG: type II toxin-antitoxin system RelE/ParE family toxin [Actinobacteria bacterium]|nr:type II toxin-antitoxin system RelE/ParE family toxin [Actinomycetota bacterium]